MNTSKNARRLVCVGLLLFLVCTTFERRAASMELSGADATEPRIEDYATIEAYVGKEEIPVYAFGYTYVYGIGPDLLPGAVMQEDNPNPVSKFKPKKSWEIAYNFCGSTPAREPKTMWNDDQPLLPVHLIDGDFETVWSSRGMLEPDVQPEWIRIDLPMESTIAAVALVCSKTGLSAATPLRLGKSLPKHLTVKVSTDGKRWDTVHDNAAFSGDDSGSNVIRFDPRRAKMVWVIGQEFEKVGYWGPSFSLGELEVLDAGGNNLALISRGAGVQVSTTHFGYGMDRYTQDMLWPIQYDLGFKWTRVGYDMGTFLWSYVEREKGKLEVDPRSDAAITEAHRSGVNVILCLDKGNWLYRNPPGKTRWKESRVKEMMETYYSHQGWPHESAELMEGYLRYVDYMVRHFKGRVAYFEICNEWQGIGLENYFKILSSAVKTIKKADPGARIMLGSTGGFDKAAILRCLGATDLDGIKEGKLRLCGRALALAKEFQARDMSLSVDANSIAEAGFLIRAKDRDNLLLAIYSPVHGGIYFHEVVNGDYGPMYVDRVMVDRLDDPHIRLTAKVEGSTVEFTALTGGKQFVARHQIQHFQEAGAVGLFHNTTLYQDFDNFVVTDPAGSVLFEDNFDRPDGPATGWDTGQLPFIAEERLGPVLDAVGWHPFYQMDPDSPSMRSYREDVRQFKKECESLGFKGAYVASEWTWAAPYPGAPDWCTEMKKAKYSAQAMAMHSGLDVISLYNETFQSGRINWDVTLLRNSSFQVDPITPSQPQPIYYVLRNVSTVLDGFEGSQFEVRYTGERKFDCDTFANDKGERMFAAWIPGKTQDGIVEAKCDMTLPGRRIGKATVYDIMNGTEQELVVTPAGNDSVLKDMLIKDYPVLVRFVAM